uniref:Secreted protein n=2 Tax=Eutreptiella gymnastica TaxID=73025 RepID=A0A7S4FYA5_9EUGL
MARALKSFSFSICRFAALCFAVRPASNIGIPQRVQQPSPTPTRPLPPTLAPMVRSDSAFFAHQFAPFPLPTPSEAMRLWVVAIRWRLVGGSVKQGKSTKGSPYTFAKRTCVGLLLRQHAQ